MNKKWLFQNDLKRSSFPWNIYIFLNSSKNDFQRDLEITTFSLFFVNIHHDNASSHKSAQIRKIRCLELGVGNVEDRSSSPDNTKKTRNNTCWSGRSCNRNSAPPLVSRCGNRYPYDVTRAFKQGKRNSEKKVNYWLVYQTL